jgi:SAM-dependent methyltransferase
VDVGARARRENDLIVYYDREVLDRAGRELPAARLGHRAAFLDLLNREGRRSLLEVGAGAGQDGIAFAAAGMSYTGVDLAPEGVGYCCSLGLDVRVASVLDLPFEEASFDAGWTMSTLLHVSDDDLDDAVAELVRVLRPGAPLAIGLWGGRESSEGPRENGAGFGPPRFFSVRTDEQLRAALRRHGTVEQWATWQADDARHYQWAVVRTPG